MNFEDRQRKLRTLSKPRMRSTIKKSLELFNSTCESRAQVGRSDSLELFNSTCESRAQVGGSDSLELFNSTCESRAQVGGSDNRDSTPEPTINVSIHLPAFDCQDTLQLALETEQTVELAMSSLL